MTSTDNKVGYSPKSVRPACSAEQAEAALRMLEGRWKLVIIFRLFERPVARLSELQRAIPAVTQKMLIQQLRALEQDGIVTRTVHAQVPPKVEYGLTDLGEALAPVFEHLLSWAARNPGR
ncbi:winged helix-turn-helix transcriptional regulator [Nonomuraea sp. M3C6]|uniref:Winged helix-turn-helix transcriptional regulator n=1 Tax=Nonomuraea marmarensis TaxID=3351344 RepID=A0ABW7AXL5_9ACTN